jgi:putative transposase
LVDAHPTRENIEKRIYKILSSLENKEVVKTSEFLKYISIKKPFDPRFTYPKESMIKSLILMKLKGIKSQTKLSKHLNENEEDASNLDFYRSVNNKILVPDQRTFSYFINKLTKEEKELIDFIVNKTEDIAQKFGIIFDVETLKPESKEKATKRTLHNRKEKKLRELCRFIRKNIYPHIGFCLRHNAVYKKEDFLNLLTYVAMTHDFTENGSKTYRRLNEKKSPTADTLLYHISKYEDKEAVQRMFKDAFDIMYKTAISSGILDNRKRVDLAIDFTEWFYYGDKNDDMVVGKKPERGTTYCYKFASINVVEFGKRITLLVLPIGKLTQKENIIRELLVYAKNKVKIKKLYVDRYFFSINMINLLKEFGVTFLMPAVRNPEVRRLMKVTPAPMVINEYQMGTGEKKTNFNLVMLEKDKKKLVFATNMDINQNDINLINKLPELYAKRWGIETSYRMKKEFRAKTTSKNYVIRLFYFLYSTLLYNLWIIIDSLISLHLFGELKDEHFVTSKIFGTVLYTLSYVT